VTEGAIDHRIRAGAWVRVAGRAYRASSTAPDERTLLEAVRLTWPDGVVLGPLAAWAHAVPIVVDPDGPVDVWVPGYRRAVAGLRPRRVALPAEDVDRWGGVAVSGARRSLLDVLALEPLDRARDVLAWAVTRNRVTLAQITEQVERWPGRAGNIQLARLVIEASGGALSAAEQRCHRLLREAGIGGWVANARVRDAHGVIGVVDVLFSKERLVIEVDGRRAHGADRFQHDRTRQNRLVAAGWTVLRFTWQDLVERPAFVVAQVRSVLTALQQAAGR